MFEFGVVIVEDETGGYVAFIPTLPGCHTQGDALGELMDNVKEERMHNWAKTKVWRRADLFENALKE